MDLQLSGDVAVVVGGAKGIGRAIASAFIAEGVERRDRRPRSRRARSSPSRTGRRRSGPGPRAHVADATDYPAISLGRRSGPSIDYGRVRPRRLRGGDRLGQVRLPVLEPRAERLGPGPPGQPRSARRTWRTPSPRAMSRGPRSGTFLFIASVAGQIGSQTDPPYSASKAGLINFAQCAAKDLAPSRRPGERPLPGDGEDRP